jgi:hypothetical protein
MIACLRSWQYTGVKPRENCVVRKPSYHASHQIQQKQQQLAAARVAAVRSQGFLPMQVASANCCITVSTCMQVLLHVAAAAVNSHMTV